MTKSVSVTLVTVALFAGICSAQLPPEPAPQSNRSVTLPWLIATGASVAGAAADAHSTNVCLAQGRVEANPLLGSRPSRGQVWGFELAMTGAQTLLSYELRKHGHRKIGMLIPALSAGEHTFAAVHNGCW